MTTAVASQKSVAPKKKTFNEMLHSQWNPTLTAWMLLAPALVFLIGFTIFPIFRSIYLGLTKYTAVMTSAEFIGFKNYETLLNDPVFGKMLLNTGEMMLLTVVPSMVLGLLIALMLNKKFRGLGFLRTAYFYPVALPMIVIACVWSYIYMARQGLLDSWMTSMGLPALDVLSSTKLALPAICALFTWREAGYLMIFFLSGLQNIDTELYEAAKIDGASAPVILWKITIPMLMPTMLFVSTVALTESIQQIDPILIMTNGGPNNSTATLMFSIYKNGFVYFDQGMASALTTIMLGIMLTIAMLQFVKADDRIHYN